MLVASVGEASFMEIGSMRFPSIAPVACSRFTIKEKNVWRTLGERSCLEHPSRRRGRELRYSSWKVFCKKVR